MTSLGFITLHHGQENSYITEIAKRSARYEIEIFRFTPSCIIPATEEINGERFHQENQEWEKATFPLPQYLYDRCFYGNDPISKKAQPIMNWLKKNPNTTFIGYGLPNKWEIYQLLKQDQDLSYYLPTTLNITSSSMVLRFLAKEERIVLKPQSGSMGHGLTGLFLTKHGIDMVSHIRRQVVRKTFSSKKAIVHYLDQLLANQNYICQPYLPIQDEENHPFDIRILLQKNKVGKWKERGRGIRRGNKDFLISNISGGAEVLPFNSWSNHLTPIQKHLLIENIQTILGKVPHILESTFDPLFEIGIDLGLAKDGSIWILDTNSKPGRKVIFETNPNCYEDIYNAPLLYCRYLWKQSTSLKRS